MGYPSCYTATIITYMYTDYTHTQMHPPSHPPVYIDYYIMAYTCTCTQTESECSDITGTKWDRLIQS